ncbi:MAG: hypothetical protein M3367_03005 [Acidobacteriota bacterium]|nr:hypothetical protein [Acidobacteriota bacterium]
MNCINCAGEWFDEVKVIQPAGKPAGQNHFPVPARAIKYQLRCADCAHIVGREVKQETKEIKQNGSEYGIEQNTIETIGTIGTKQINYGNGGSQTGKRRRGRSDRLTK